MIRHEIAARLGEVRQRARAVAASNGRSPESVCIVAVGKRQPLAAIEAAYDAGQRDFGENYVQEAHAKIAASRASMPEAVWHLVGRLQSNKAATALADFALLHGLDSLRTIAALGRAAARSGASARVLVQIRLGGAGARAGIDAADAPRFVEDAARESGIAILGLMGVADPAAATRPQFARLRDLADRLGAGGGPPGWKGELSMGMTQDYEDAIAEGATLVRIGTAIFGDRPAPAAGRAAGSDGARDEDER